MRAQRKYSERLDELSRLRASIQQAQRQKAAAAAAAAAAAVAARPPPPPPPAPAADVAPVDVSEAEPPQPGVAPSPAEGAEAAALLPGASAACSGAELARAHSAPSSRGLQRQGSFLGAGFRNTAGATNIQRQATARLPSAPFHLPPKPSRSCAGVVAATAAQHQQRG